MSSTTLVTFGGETRHCGHTWRQDWHLSQHGIWHIFQWFNYEEILLCEDQSYSSFFILRKLMMLHLLKMLKRWDRDRKFYEEVICKEWNERSLWYSGYDGDWEVLVTGTRWIILWIAPLTVEIRAWVLRPVLCVRAVYTRCSLAPTRWTRLPRSMTSWGHQTPLFLTSWRGEHTNSLCLLFSNISV